MGSKTFEVPGVLALILFLAANYAFGYWLGIRLTDSVIVALLLAFVMPCLSMFGFVLIATGGYKPHGGGQARPH